MEALLNINLVISLKKNNDNEDEEDDNNYIKDPKLGNRVDISG